MIPSKDENKINLLYPLAWCAFLLLPVFILYNGFKHHNLLAVIASCLAIAGFTTLIVIAFRHNRKIAKKRNMK